MLGHRLPIPNNLHAKEIKQIPSMQNFGFTTGSFIEQVLERVFDGRLVQNQCEFEP